MTRAVSSPGLSCPAELGAGWGGLMGHLQSPVTCKPHPCALWEPNAQASGLTGRNTLITHPYEAAAQAASTQPAWDS